MKKLCRRGLQFASACGNLWSHYKTPTETTAMQNQVAQTILAQLGGDRFSFMVGAKSIVGHKTGLSFKLGRNALNANCCEIHLNGDDTYTLALGRVSVKGLKALYKQEGLYAEMLAADFSEATGLALSLGTMGR